MNLLSPLKVRAFRFLYLGQVVSDLGNWMSFMALMILFTYHWKLPPEKLALVPITLSLPWILLSPFSGVWVERFSKRNLMIFCDFIRSILSFSMLFTNNFWVLLVIICLIQSAATFFDPAKQVAIKTYVPEPFLIKANALSQISLHLSKIIAPSIGGILITIHNPSLVFMTNSVSFFLSALLLMKLPKTDYSNSMLNKSKKGTFLKEIVTGFQKIFTNTLLCMAVCSMFFTTFLVFIYDSFIALWSKELGIAVSSFSLQISGISLGSLLGAVIVGQFGNRIQPIKLLFISPFFIGLFFSIIGLGGIHIVTFHEWLWLSIWSLIGFLGASIPISYGTILQTTTPTIHLGKIYSSAQSILNIPTFVAPLIGAWIVRTLGIGYVFLLSGIFFTLFSITGLVILRRINRLNLDNNNGKKERTDVM
ncbi:MFS transporter [Gottfriedia sp. NPDC056225]|uniref:MFS transporter n=1 Tax=Gottfriedia sp. NPDC056225 TaxID=3345751 RepID=UPI0035E315C6